MKIELFTNEEMEANENNESEPFTDEEIEAIENDTGYIYIINTNIEVNGKPIYRIGITINVDKRIKQINADEATIFPHTIIKTYHVNRPCKVGGALHDILDFGRVNPNKEMFYSNVVIENMDLIKSIIKVFEI